MRAGLEGVVAKCVAPCTGGVLEPQFSDRPKLFERYRKIVLRGEHATVVVAVPRRGGLRFLVEVEGRYMISRLFHTQLLVEGVGTKNYVVWVVACVKHYLTGVFVPTLF